MITRNRPRRSSTPGWLPAWQSRETSRMRSTVASSRAQTRARSASRSSSGELRPRRRAMAAGACASAMGWRGEPRGGRLAAAQSHAGRPGGELLRPGGRQPARTAPRDASLDRRLRRRLAHEALNAELVCLRGSADADLLPALPELRNRSRDLARNNPLAGGAINTVVTNVIGTGRRLSRPSMPKCWG